MNFFFSFLIGISFCSGRNEGNRNVLVTFDPIWTGVGWVLGYNDTNQDRRGLQVSPKGDLTILEARGDHAGKF